MEPSLFLSPPAIPFSPSSKVDVQTLLWIYDHPENFIHQPARVANQNYYKDNMADYSMIEQAAFGRTVPSASLTPANLLLGYAAPSQLTYHSTGSSAATYRNSFSHASATTSRSSISATSQGMNDEVCKIDGTSAVFSIDLNDDKTPHHQTELSTSPRQAPTVYESLTLRPNQAVEVDEHFPTYEEATAKTESAVRSGEKRRATVDGETPSRMKRPRVKFLSQ
jgi:hypothetical protein